MSSEYGRVRSYLDTGCDVLLVFSQHRNLSCRESGGCHGDSGRYVVFECPVQGNPSGSYVERVDIRFPPSQPPEQLLSLQVCARFAVSVQGGRAGGRGEGGGGGQKMEGRERNEERVGGGGGGGGSWRDGGRGRRVGRGGRGEEREGGWGQ